MRYPQLIIYCLLGLVACVLGDKYLHNPRGSNNRLNEGGARNNENRLFNSQNNNNGGYCWGPPLTYYEGSHLSIEWTNQHSCGIQNTECNIILQYMCSSDTVDDTSTSTIRDGDTTVPSNTGTIPANGDATAGKDYFNYINPDSGQYFYGMHESFDYYTKCRSRQRNMGLFTADQGLNNGAGAMATRQSAGGNQYGFECAEERDYYPYWHPSPWKDIAILTSQTSNCGFYKSQSQNVKAKNWCWGESDQAKNANNQGDCQVAGGEWKTTPSWDIPAPHCGKAPYGRDNHLGNGMDGHTQSYNWTIPKKGRESCIGKGCNCVLRARYNISTSETVNWGNNMADWKSSGQKSPIKQDPYVMIGDKNVSLALNTNQYGRTFQDRSYVWKIKARPKGMLSTASIYNLNVRGKRGNIVQAYPSVEYDFVPTHLDVKINDYVHFQWTGCDTNPGGSAGEGLDKTDRSNIVQIRDRSYNYPLSDSDFKKYDITPMFDSAKLRYKMAHLDQTDCLTYEDLFIKNNGNAGAMKTDPQNCMKLNAASAYFDGGLVRVNKTGTFYYMSSRNNNFTNRTQKATLQVNDLIPKVATAFIVIGGVAAVAAASAAGAVIYSKRNPHSRVAGFVGKMPLLNRI